MHVLKRALAAGGVTALAVLSTTVAATAQEASTAAAVTTTTAPGSGDIIYLVAGNGSAGFAGDGGQARLASLYLPTGVASNAVGDLFVADTANNRVRKIAKNGIITTVAGNGSSGFSGDGGSALAAAMRAPTGVAVDGAGNIYVSDTGNHRVRKISTAGIITTYAGTGDNGFSNDGRPATLAKLSFPTGLSVDSGGTLYIADTGNNRIRKVTSAGIISTVAGGGSAGGGNCGNTRGSSMMGISSPGPGGGSGGDASQATNARLCLPTGVAKSGAGDIFIADTGNERVRKVNPSGVISNFAGTGTSGYSGDGGPATSAKLDDPTGVGVDPLGNVFISDSGNNRIRQVKTTGVIVTFVGTGVAGYFGDGTPCTTAKLNFPAGNVVATAADVFFSDTFNHRVRGCHRGGPPPVLPDSPFPVLLPLTAVGVGAVMLVARKRRLSQGVLVA